MDFDKLIIVVLFELEHNLEILNDILSWLPLELVQPPSQSQLYNMFDIVCGY